MGLVVIIISIVVILAKKIQGEIVILAPQKASKVQLTRNSCRMVGTREIKKKRMFH